MAFFRLDMVNGSKHEGEEKMTKKHQNMIATAERQLDNDGRLKDSTYAAIQREIIRLIRADQATSVVACDLSDLVSNG
jgi:uncharacterized membrane-anchored protein